MPDKRAIIEKSIEKLAGSELSGKLLAEYEQLIQRFLLGDYRPAELSGARFCEAAFRVCQQVCQGSYTPIGNSLPRTDKLIEKLANTPASQADDTFRIHIPRSLRLVYDLRSKRDVAHLGDGVSPNCCDSNLVVTIVSWVLADIVRVGYECDGDLAQGLIDGLVQRPIPVVWEEEGVVRILDTSLSAKQKVLVLLAHKHPAAVSDADLCAMIEYSNASMFRKTVLSALHKEAMIDYRNGSAKVLPPGLAHVSDILGS